MMYRADPTRRRAVVESCGVRALDARDAAPDRESNKTRDILDAQLQHDAAAVGVDARRRDIKPSSDFLARATVDDQFQDLALAPAQSLERILPNLCHVPDGIWHVGRLVCCITPQRRATARPHDPAVLAAIISVARNLLATQ